MGETYRPNPEEQASSDVAPERDEAKERRSALSEKVYRILKRWALYGITATSLGYGLYKGIEQNVERYYEQYSKQYPDDDQHGDVERKLRDDLQFVVGDNIKDVAYGDIRAREQHDSSRAEPEVRGFDSLGIAEADIQELFQDGRYFPKNYINGEVKGIYLHEEMSRITTYSAGGTQRSTTLATANKESEVIKMTFPQGFHKDPQEVRNYLDSVFSLTAHEVAHLNSWSTDQDLNLLERYQLLSRVLERLRSTDHVRGVATESISGPNAMGYVDFIHKEHEDSPDRHYLEAEEYWAEIVKYYLLFPDWMQAEHPQDFALAQEYIQKNDPDFDPFKAAAQRSVDLTKKFGPGVDNLMEVEPMLQNSHEFQKQIEDFNKEFPQATAHNK